MISSSEKLEARVAACTSGPRMKSMPSWAKDMTPDLASFIIAKPAIVGIQQGIRGAFKRRSYAIV